MPLLNSKSMKSLHVLLCCYTFLLLLGACFSSGKADKQKQIQQAFLHQEIGMGYLEAKKYPEALRQLLTANELAPQQPQIINNLALAYHYRGKSQEAIKLLKQALLLEPKLTEARSNLARIYIEQKLYAQALEELKIARDDLTYSYPERVHTHLATVYLEMNQLEAAEAELQLALKTKRDYCPARFQNVKILYTKKDYKVGAIEADKCIYSCPSTAIDEAFYLAGMSYYFAGFPDKAKNRLEQLVREYPASEFSNKAHPVLEQLEGTRK